MDKTQEIFYLTGLLNMYMGFRCNDPNMSDNFVLYQPNNLGSGSISREIHDTLFLRRTSDSYTGSPLLKTTFTHSEENALIEARVATAMLSIPVQHLSWAEAIRLARLTCCMLLNNIVANMDE